MKKTLVYAAAIAACAISCAKNEPVETPSAEPVEVQFSAASEACTKTGIGADGKTVEWKAGDKVSLLSGEKNLLYTAESDGATTSLVPSGEGLMSNEGAVWAVYPYSSDNTVSESGVSVIVPATHSVSATGFAEGSNVAVAYAPELQENTTLNFKNVCSYLKLTFKAEQGVNKVVLSSEGNAVALAGTATVKMNADGIPELVSVAPGAATSVTLESTAALDGIYLIPVLPGGAAKWQLTFTKTDGTVSTAAMGKAAAAFERNTPLSYDFSGVTINWKQAPTAVTADKVFWSDAHISWMHEGKADSYEVYVNNELSATVESGATKAHITGLANGTTYSIKVVAVYGAEKKESEAVSITTGKIEQLVKNVSPTSVAVGIENRAGALSGNYKPCLYVQLFESEDVSGTPKYEAFVRDNEVLSEGHPFYKSLVAGSGTTYAPFNLAFGGLEAGKDYWFRVKSVASDTYKTYRAASISGESRTMESQNGDSEYSKPFRLTTAQKHTAAENEVLFEGFDDCIFSADFINCAVGLMPAFRTQTKLSGTNYNLNRNIWTAWENEGKAWSFHGLRIGFPNTHMAALGFLNPQKGDTDITFEGGKAAAVKYWVTESQSSTTLLAPSVLKGARIGSFRAQNTTGFESMVGDNRFITMDSYMGEGYAVLGMYYDSSEKQTSTKKPAAFVVKAVSNLAAAEKKSCTVTFRALAVQGRSGKITVIHFNKDGNHRKAASDLWDTVTEIKVANSNGNIDENATDWSGLSETHKWYEYSFDIDLLQGDLVGFATDSESCICIDDIKIVLK